MKPEALFYRIEDAQGVGPYRGERCYDCHHLIEEATGENVYSSDELHPSPRQDALLVASCPEDFFTEGFFGKKFTPPEEYLFGFNGIEQLHHWFYDAAHYLAFAETQFRISIYRGEIISGSKQAILRAQTRELIKVMDAVEFYDEHLSCFERK